MKGNIRSFIQFVYFYVKMEKKVFIEIYEFPFEEVERGEERGVNCKKKCLEKKNIWKNLKFPFFGFNVTAIIEFRRDVVVDVCHEMKKFPRYPNTFHSSQRVSFRLVFFFLYRTI